MREVPAAKGPGLREEAGALIERWAGLAPAFPHGKWDVFPWTTNARLHNHCPGRELKIHYTAGTVRGENGRGSAPGSGVRARPSRISPGGNRPLGHRPSLASTACKAQPPSRVGQSVSPRSSRSPRPTAAKAAISWSRPSVGAAVVVNGDGPAGFEDLGGFGGQGAVQAEWFAGRRDADTSETVLLCPQQYRSQGRVKSEVLLPVTGPRRFVHFPGTSLRRGRYPGRWEGC